jgi:hypothetical protein
VAGSRIWDHRIRKILEQSCVADGKARALFGIRGARSMTVQASGSRGRDLRRPAGLDFDVQRQTIARQHTSRNVV